MPLVTTPKWSPQSEADKEAVQRQLARLFAHHTFRSSRRCPAFLQYIVEHQLKGDTDRLKERIIGAEVFGRNADYDTSADPVVRTTASEVRKRIAQYYQEPGHEDEIRIELPLGSYAAEFNLPQNNGHPAESLPAPLFSVHTNQESTAAVFEKTQHSRLSKRAILAATVTVLLVAAAAWWMIEGRSSVTQRFWNPVVVSHNPVLICLNTWDLTSLLRDSKSPLATSIGQAVDSSQWLPINDAVAFSQLAGFLGAMRSDYRVQGARTTTLSDLMQSPSVLIGVFGNPWTQRVTDPLRFHFVREGGRSYLADRKEVSKQYAIENGGVAEGAKDYAIVARIFNPATGQVSFVVAGLDAAGTTAASQFVTTPRYMDSLKNALPAISNSNNVEALISVRVIDGKPGAPYVELAEAW